MIALLLFEKLRKIFSETAKNLSQKSISKKEIDSILVELQISLMENDVGHEIGDEMTSKIKTEISSVKLERNENIDEVITTKLYSFLHELFSLTTNKTDIIQSILEKKRSKSGPYSIIFLGINGTGKTTTIAKFCKLLRDNGISVVLAAADTHRAGAIEQISHHGNNLNVKVISQRYGADPSAVARDALEHAKKNYIDAVLIDTAGRMQTSKNLMEEVSKIIRVIKPDIKAESMSKDVDKFKTNNESVSTPPTVELERKDLDNEVRLVPDQVYDEQMRKNEETNEETSETKSKKRSFFNKFSRDRKNEDATIDGKSPSNKDIKTKKDKSKKGTENEKEEVVYLTDDDINDLIK